MDARSRVARAEALIEIERWPEAQRELQPALASPETAARAYGLLAHCLLETGDAHGAIERAGKAIAAGDLSDWPHVLMASGFLRTGQYDRALAAAQDAVRLVPESVNARVMLAAALRARGDAGEATLVAERLVADYPESVAALLAMGASYQAERRFDEAELVLRRALQVEPHSADVTLALADALHGLGRQAEAAELYLGVAAARPADKRATLSLAMMSRPVAGGAALLVVVLAAQLVRTLVFSDSRLSAALIWVIVGGSIGAAFSLLHVRGGRVLPGRARLVMGAEYRNYALGYVASIGIGTMIIALTGVFSSTEGATCRWLVAGGAAALLFARRMRAGPRDIG